MKLSCISYRSCLIAAAALVLVSPQCKRSNLEIMAITGATPTAYAEQVPAGITLKIDGMVKKQYTLSDRALSALAPTILRTQEITPTGEFEGTYRYIGIPLYTILEGVAPQKPKDAAFDRPLDMLVTFTSSSGKKVQFSYGELTMTDDSRPVILAYYRQEVRPTDEKTRASYRHNKHHGTITGLRLVCPGDPDNGRYLDDVKSITLGEPAVANAGLPVMVKGGSKCSSDSIVCVSQAKSPFGPKALQTAGARRMRADRWIRVGHGRGFKEIATAEGYNLIDLLKANFPGCGADNYFLFIACDGYRALFSGREIFATEAGKSMMLIDRVNGKKQPGGPMLGPVADYFVDRDIWGLSHIVMLDAAK